MKSLVYLAVVAFALVVSGCALDESEFETRGQELAVDGPWVPDAEALALSESYNIVNVQAGPWVGTSGCSGSFTPGGASFKEWLLNNWPQVSGVGGYACRAINGNSASMSVHATGRALDIHIPLDGGEADNDLGDPLANWLMLHADEIGIQAIIWDRWIWSTSRTPRSRAYTGAHPHHDHLHIELTPAAGRMETPWFKGDMGPPTLSGCDDPLPADGGVVDDSDNCFQAFGPAQYWRRVDGTGVNGGTRWTNAFKSDDPSNWARWRLNLSEAGTYRVEFSHSAEWGVYDSAEYEVRHNGTQTEVFVDLSAIEGEWEVLGEFEFAAGADQWVSLYDNADIELPEDQHIEADAVRLTRVGVSTPVNNDVGPNPDHNNTNNGSNPDPLDPDYPMMDDNEIHASGEGCSVSGSATPDLPTGLILLLGLVLFRRRRET